MKMTKDSVIQSMTIDESAANDKEMFAVTIRNAKAYGFNDPKKAVSFVGACIGGSLEYLGIPFALGLTPDQLDAVQDEKGIGIEKRSHYHGPDAWKNGMYIYSKDIMVAFISDIFTPKATPAVLMPALAQFVVITNARVR